jgi:hypothetical protein
MSKQSAKNYEGILKKHRTRSSFRSSKDIENVNNTLKKLSLSKDYLNTAYNVYAEVRGKYARPAPLLNHPAKSNDLNPVLNRPTTAGSLRPKSSLHAYETKSLKSQDYKNDMEAYNPRTTVYAKHSRTPSRAYHRIMKQSKPDPEPHQSKPEVPETVKNLNLSTQDAIINTQDPRDGPDDKGLDLTENPENLDLDLTQDPQEDLNAKNEAKEDAKTDTRSSKASWKTTSSQRRYIQELEDLLREEKLKRIRLEEMVGKILSK